MINDFFEFVWAVIGTIILVAILYWLYGFFGWWVLLIPAFPVLVALMGPPSIQGKDSIIVIKDGQANRYTKD